MGRARLNGQSGAREVEDIIQSYIVSADGNISAGDLCEFVNGQVRTTKLKTADLKAVTNIPVSSKFKLKALQVNSTQVLVIGVNNSTNLLWGQLHEVNEITNTVSSGALTQLSSVMIRFFDACKLSDSQVFLTYTSTADNTIRSVVLSLSGNTVFVNTVINVNGYVPYNIIAVSATPTTACVYFVHANQAIWYLTWSISGTNLSTLNQAQWQADSYTTFESLQISKIQSGYYLVSFLKRHNTDLTGTTFLAYAVKIDGGANPTPFGGISSGNYNVGEFAASNVLNGNFCLAMLDQSTGVLSVSKYKVTINTTAMTSTFEYGTPLYGIVRRSVHANIAVVMLEDSIAMLNWTDAPYSGLYTSMLTFSGCYPQAMTTPILMDSVQRRYLLETVMVNGRILQVYSLPGNSNYIEFLEATYIRGLLKLKKVVSTEKPQGVALNSANAGETVKLLIKGIKVVGQTLEPNATYYCNEAGKLVKDPTIFPIGIALNVSELSVNTPWWERGL